MGNTAIVRWRWYWEHLIITFLWFPPTITSPNKTFWKKRGNNNTTTLSTGGQTVGFWWCWLLCRCVVMCLYEGRVRWPPHSQPQHPATIWDTSHRTTHHCLSSHQSSPSLADSLILEGCQATDISYNQNYKQVEVSFMLIIVNITLKVLAVKKCL